MMRGARTIVDNCAAIKPNEKVLIITDTKLIKIGEVLTAAVYEREAEPILTIMQPRTRDGQEPPNVIAEAMKHADVVFSPVSKSITHTNAVKEAVKAGARILVMTAFTEKIMISGGIEADFKAQRPVCIKLAKLLMKADKLHLTNPAGTDLSMSIKGRRGNALTGVVDEPRIFSTIPTIEANVSPIEGSTEGKIVVDASIPYLDIGLLREPVNILVKKGYIKEIWGGYQADILKKNLEEKEDPNVYNIAEVGIGLNPKSEMTGVMLDDEGVLGSAHIGIGTNITLGGTIKAAIHYDLVLWRPTIRLEDETVIENGEPKFYLTS
jgi:leucyl aminopeptidase (aminopeptidase T)